MKLGSTNRLTTKPGLVAQSVTQAVARRSLDGILNVWDQCCHWFIHEGDRQKARHSWPTKRATIGQGMAGKGREMMSPSPHLEWNARSRVRVPLGTKSSLTPSMTSKPALKPSQDGCLRLSQEKNATIDMGVSMLVSWPNNMFNCMHL